MLKRNSLQDRLYIRGRLWWVWGYDSEGKRWREPTGQTQRPAALEVAKTIEIRRALPAAQKKVQTTIGQALKAVIENAERAGQRPKTITNHLERGKHLLEHIDKNAILCDFNLDMSDAYMDKRLADGASRHSIQGEFRLLIQACHLEKNHDRYPGEPSRLMPIALRDKANFYKPPKTWLDTPEQCQALIDAMSQHRAADGGWKRGIKRQFVIDQGPHVSSALIVERARAVGIKMTVSEVGTARCNERYAATRAAKRKKHTVDRKLHVAAYIHSGMRDAELDLPCPEDIDLESSMMHVRGTKTDGADRYVAMSPTMTEIVRQKMIGKRRGEPLFEPWGSIDRDLKLAWRKARAAHFAQCDKEGRLPVGMWPEKISANTLRRTFCSLMYNAGVPPQVCAELMGHESLDMVMQVYGHLSKDALRAAVNKLPAFTLPAPPQAAARAPSPICHTDRHSDANSGGGATRAVSVLVSVESRKRGLDAQIERLLGGQNR